MAFSDPQTDDAAAQAEKALRLPIGAASPLWFAYAAFAGAGVAYWWMTRLAKPINFEAYSFKVMQPAETADVPDAPDVVTETLAALLPEPVAPSAEPVVDPSEPAAQVAEAVADLASSATEAVGEAAVTASIAADDLTRLVGIGPTLAAKLANLGVKTFVDIASWTGDDLEKMDKALDLKGRAVREGWVDQARQFTAQ